MGVTSIEWTDRTWNPTRGCSRVSPGCVNCYAERMASRFINVGESFHGFAKRTPSGPRWTGKVELIEDKLNEPLSWRKPARVFVNSMSDLFHEALPFSAIDDVFTTMVAANWHTYQILTKRPARMLEYFRSGRHLHGGPDRADFHLDGQIWLGVSCENQETANERIPLLLQTPAAIRFVSYEPALGPVDFERCFPSGGFRDWQGLHWIIVGGESGPGARPFDIEWARNTVTQCREAMVACFVKQLGARVVSENSGEGKYWTNHEGDVMGPVLRDKKGGDMDEWPEDLRVRQFPQVTP